MRAKDVIKLQNCFKEQFLKYFHLFLIYYVIQEHWL